MLGAEIACSSQGAKEIAAALCENKSLRKLKLARNALTDEGVAFLAEVRPLSLSLSCSHFFQTTLRCLFSDPPPHHLTASRRPPSPDACTQALATKNSTLLDLDIAETGLGDAGATSLANALASPSCGLQR
eukprot:3924005-Rhodomonas_salina.1